MTERRTKGVHSPCAVQRWHHLCQPCSVASSARSALKRFGIARCEAPCERLNARRSPSATSNCATCVKFSAVSGTGDRADAMALVLELPHPRHRGAIVEAQDELQRHLHAAASADDDARELAV